MPHRFCAYQATRRHHAGFTLAELLVVVAIVLVLVAVAVPVFTGATAKAQEATCAGNRRSLKVIMSDAYMMTQTVPNQHALDEHIKSLIESNNNQALCPAGGNYSLTGDATAGSIIITCSKHGISMDDEMYGNVQESLNGNWWASLGINGDSGAREKYAKDYGLTEWPTVTGTDGKSFYLQFKSYSNNSSGSFLYAGYGSQITGGGDQWNAKYVCDSKGVAGPAGQWYELPKKTGLTGLKTDEDFKKLLTSGEKVTLSGGEFKSA